MKKNVDKLFICFYIIVSVIFIILILVRPNIMIDRYVPFCITVDGESCGEIVSLTPIAYCYRLLIYLLSLIFEIDNIAQLIKTKFKNKKQVLYLMIPIIILILIKVLIYH